MLKSQVVRCKPFLPAPGERMILGDSGPDSLENPSVSEKPYLKKKKKKKKKSWRVYEEDAQNMYVASTLAYTYVHV
jgi:hypothetical protein